MFILFFFFALFPVIVQASSVAHAGVPWSLIISQLVNFGILFFLARFFLKKPLALAINKQRESFLSAEKSVGKKANEAKLLLQQWQEKWDKLSESFTKKIKEAKANSLQLSTEHLASAKTQTVNILEKAEVQIQTELSQAKVHLAELLLQTSCDVALDNQKKQTSSSSINLSLLKNISENKVFNEKN